MRKGVQQATTDVGQLPAFPANHVCWSILSAGECSEIRKSVLPDIERLH